MVWCWVVASWTADLQMVVLSFLHEDLQSEHAEMIQTHLLVAGLKHVNNEMVFELVVRVLEVILALCFWVGGPLGC